MGKPADLEALSAAVADLHARVTKLQAEVGQLKGVLREALKRQPYLRGEQKTENLQRLRRVR